MDKVKITPNYTAREQRLRNRLEETSFQLAQQTELAGGYLLEVFSLKGQLEAAEATIKAAGELAEKWLTTARSKHMCDIDNTVDIRCAEQLQQLLSKQEQES